MDEQEIRGRGDCHDELLRKREWRAERLEQLGLSRLTARRSAANVDWQDVARLVSRGCIPELAEDRAAESLDAARDRRARRHPHGKDRS